VDGKLIPVEGSPTLSADDVKAMAMPLLTDGQRQIFNEQMDVDFAFSWRDLARVRGSIFTQRGQAAVSLRIIPSQIPTFEKLGLPWAAEWVAQQPRGFVLVTGPTGSGNRPPSRRSSIALTRLGPRTSSLSRTQSSTCTINKKSAVTQREIGLDSPSFDRALRSALREDPDILLIGEMRDIDSIQIALTMAETGHLVFATLHTNDAAQAIDRIIDVFPAWRQEQTRVQLAASLSAIVAQRLVPKVGGGMVAAFEVLIATSPVRNLIREAARTN